MSVSLDPDRQRAAQRRCQEVEAEWAYHDAKARSLAARADLLARAWDLDPSNGYEPKPPALDERQAADSSP